MEKIAAIVNRLSTAAVVALILTGFTASISSVVNAEELTVAMVNVSAATKVTDTENPSAAEAPEALSAELIEEVREDLARRLHANAKQPLQGS